MPKQMTNVGDDDKYELLGVDWKATKMGVPVWGWAAGLGGLAYYFFFRKKR